MLLTYNLQAKLKIFIQDINIYTLNPCKKTTNLFLL
jgi:hypothetical protein